MTTYTLGISEARVVNSMSPRRPSAPRAATFGFEAERTGRPGFALAIRQSRQVRSPVEKEAECVGGEGSGGFRVVELPGADFVAPEIECQQAVGTRVVFRVDATFAKPKIYNKLLRSSWVTVIGAVVALAS